MMKQFEPLSDLDAATATLYIESMVGTGFEKRLVELSEPQYLPALRYAWRRAGLLALRLGQPVDLWTVNVHVVPPCPYRAEAPQAKTYQATFSAGLFRKNLSLSPREVRLPSGWCWVTIRGDYIKGVTLPQGHFSKVDAAEFSKAPNIYFSDLCWRVTEKPAPWNPYSDELKQVQQTIFGRNPTREVVERFHAMTRPNRCNPQFAMRRI
jgi:hypothetical protein